MKYGYDTAIESENFTHYEALEQCKTEEETILENIRHQLDIKNIEKQFELEC